MLYHPFLFPYGIDMAYDDESFMSYGQRVHALSFFSIDIDAWRARVCYLFDVNLFA